MLNISINTFVCVALLGALAPALPAAAQSDADPISVSVRYSDLDVSRPEGANILLRRVNRAADQACGGEPDIRLIREHSQYANCKKLAVDRALGQLPAPVVTAAAAMTGPFGDLAKR